MLTLNLDSFLVEELRLKLLNEEIEPTIKPKKCDSSNGFGKGVQKKTIVETERDVWYIGQRKLNRKARKNQMKVRETKKTSCFQA